LLPRYFYQLRRFSNLSRTRIRFLDLYPCLNDNYFNGFDFHYFYQAAWLSRKLSNDRALVHYDFGSDLKLMGILSAFIDIKFFDIRYFDPYLTGLYVNSADIKQLPLTDGECN